MAPMPPPPRRNVLRSAAKFLYEHSVSDAWMELDDIPRAQRLLVRGGYLLLALVVVVILLLEQLQRKDFLAWAMWDDFGRQVTYIFGWLFFLTGAVLSRRRILLPIVALFTLLTLSTLIEAFNILTLLLLVFLVGGTLAVGLVPPLREVVSRYPLSYFLPASLLLAFLFFVSGPGQAVGQLFMLPFVVLVLVVIWLVAGLAIVDFGADVARWIVQRLARWFSPDPLGAVILFALFLRLQVALVLSVFIFLIMPQDEAQYQAMLDSYLLFFTYIVSEVFLTVPVFLWLAALAVSRRWSPRSILTAFAVSIVSPVFTLGLVLAVQGIDISDAVGTATKELGLVPPLLLFVFFLTVTLLALGSSFAATDGRLIPRGARIYLALGAVLLILNGVLLLSGGLGLFSVSVEGLQDFFFPLGLIFLGVPYLLYLIFRRRQQLIGDAAERVATRSIWPALDRIAPRRLVGGVAIVGTLLIGGTCAFGELVGVLLGR